MSIRLRLLLHCGLLCCLILTVAIVLSYAFHARSHYEELDQILAGEVTHRAAELLLSNASLLSLERSGANGGLEIVLRLYGVDGALNGKSSNDVSVPATDPRRVLSQPSGPAFDTLAGLVSTAKAPSAIQDGAFGLVDVDDKRWRVYILPFRQGQTIIGYLEGLTPLQRLDASMQGLRILLLALWGVGTTTMLFGLWVMATQVLRPVVRMTQAAQAIALSRDFAKRVETPPYRDELRHLAQTFNKMLENLEAAFRLQQRFVSDASHELRAPLTVIQGNLELLCRQQNMPLAERAEALTEAEREAARLARLVAELLTLARADAGVLLKHNPVDLDEIVLEAFQEARKLTRGQDLGIDTFEPVRVEGDADRLKQLLIILLDNALKYTPHEGKVSIGLRRRNGQAEIVVRDSGIGIAADDLPHVFERFYRADLARSRDPGGSGLGLSIARWIAEQHGGRVILTSAQGQGTTAVVSLPTA